MVASFDASVLIVAYRSRAHIARLGRCLAEQSVRPKEILLLENGSPQGERITGEELPPGFRLLTSDTNSGFAAGNNRLAREASGRWLVLLNPDAFPEPDWLEQLQQAAGRWPDCTMFGSTQLADGEAGVLDGAGDVYHVTGLPYRAGYGRRITPPGEGEVFAPCGAAAMIRRDLFDSLGGFDEDYFCYVEDIDFAYRARLLGHYCIQVSAARVTHLGYASSARRSVFATYYGARNRFWTFFKNTPGWLLWVLAPLHLAMTILLWLSAARFGQFSVFGRAIADALKGWSGLWRKRRAIQARRTVPVRAIGRAMSVNPLNLVTRAPDVRPRPPRMTPPRTEN